MWKCKNSGACGIVRIVELVEVSEWWSLWKCENSVVCVEVSEWWSVWICQNSEVCGSVRVVERVEVSE